MIDPLQAIVAAAKAISDRAVLGFTYLRSSERKSLAAAFKSLGEVDVGTLGRVVSPRVTSFTANPATGLISLTWSEFDTLGAVTRTLTRSPSFAGTVTPTAASYVDNAISDGASYTYSLVIRDSRSLDSASVSVSTTATGTSSGYPLVASGGYNVLGGRRDLQLQPFLNTAWPNVSLGSGALYSPALMYGLPQISELTANGSASFGSNSGYNWVRNGFNYGDYRYQPVGRVSEVYCETDSSQPLTGVYDHAFNPGAAVDGSNPISNKAVQVGSQITTLPANPSLIHDPDNNDGIASFSVPGGRYAKCIAYFCRVAGGNLLGFFDYGRTPVQTDLAGDALDVGGGGAHVGGQDSRMGVMLDGHLVPESSGGRGAPQYVLKCNLQLFRMRQTQGQTNENRRFPGEPIATLLARNPSHTFSGEFSVAGEDNVNRATSLVTYDARLALPTSFNVSSLKTVSGRLLGQTLQDYGMVHCDSTYGSGTPMHLYGIKTATTSFHDSFSAYNGFAFDQNYLYCGMTSLFETRHGWRISTSTAQRDFADDLVTMVDNLQVVRNAGPAGVANGGVNASGVIGDYGNGYGGGGTPRKSAAPL